MTVKEFYDYCVEHHMEDHKIMTYYITQFGDVTASGELTTDGIHVDAYEKENTIWLWLND